MAQTDRRLNVSGSAAFKLPCRVATTANITLSGLQTIDGVTVVADDRVLVRNQTTGTENGIYVADTSTWQRAIDFNGPRDCVQGTIVAVNSGTTYAETTWQLTTSSPVIGTTSLAFTLMSGGLLSEGSLGLAVTNLAALKALISRPELVTIEGYTTAGDGGHGPFYWDEGSNTTADDALVVQPTAGTAGRYKRLWDGRLDVKWFGAKGDGTTDDKPAFAAAVVAAAAAGGGVVYAPSDIYRFASGLVITSSNIHLMGDGPSATWIKGDFATGDVVCIGDGTTLNFCTISDMRIDGGASTRTAGASVRVRNGHAIELARLRFAVNQFACVQLDGGADQFLYRLTDLEMNLGSYGVRIGSTGGIVQECWLSGITTDAMTVAAIELTFLSGGDFQGLNILRGQVGILANPGASQYVTACHFDRARPDTCVTNGWKLQPTAASGSITDWTIDNSWASSCGTGAGAAATLAGMLIDPNGGTISGLSINIRAVNNKGDGIRYAGGTEVTFDDCHILCNSQSASGTYHGLWVAAGVSKWTVMGGIYGTGGRIAVAASNFQGYGILVAVGGSDQYRVISGNMLGNVTGGISDGGTGTDKQVIHNIGYVTEKSGTGSVASGATTAVVTHGLSVTPAAKDITVNFTEQGTADYGRFWLDTFTSTQFTVNVSTNPGASNLDFSWAARVL